MKRVFQNSDMVKYEIPLAYSYNALEPHIYETTTRIHHTKRHQAYTDGLNETLMRINAISHKSYIIGILSDLNSVPGFAGMPQLL